MMSWCMCGLNLLGGETERELTIKGLFTKLHDQLTENSLLNIKSLFSCK